MFIFVNYLYCSCRFFICFSYISEHQEIMAETQTLNFGPEWLRALSGGGSVTSPPLSPALPKYKLADYRYGREEMLALYVKDNKIPVDLQDKEFLSILQEEPLPPLALVPFTEEEQRNFMSVNSAAVLRLTGRGGGTVAGAPRGRSSSRGRGRGRGEGGFYQRSFDDVEGGFGRAREMHRSQSWEERGDRRFEKPGRKEPVRSNYEDSGTGAARKHEFTRSESENWRTSREEHNGEDDEGGWRLAGSRRDSDRWRPHSPDGLRSSGWREHPDSRRRFPFDSREEERGYRRARTGSSSQDEERDGLPEWCLDDADEEMGTFDSSGAFLSLKKAPKEPIPEEAELDFRPSEECEERLEREDNDSDETKETEEAPPRQEEIPASAPVMQQKPPEVPSVVPTPHCFPEDVSQIGRPGALLHVDTDDDEGLKHFEQEAEKMVAYLQDNAVDDDRLTTKMAERVKPTAFPLTHDAALKWFYKDPQGEIQGPFTNQEMMEWFQAGYFTMTLLVKRGCDDVFQPLGEIIKMWGRVPFTPGPTPPPLLYRVFLSYLAPCRQQYAQALAQHKATALGASQQQQQINLLLQQYQALKMRWAADSGTILIWLFYSAWDSGSVWDLPIDSMAPAPTIEQMQQVEKAKAAKMEQERHEAELQAKREEEERKRQEEALLRQQEEERKRREEEEQARRNKEEALRRLLEQEAALRRQKEEEERQAQERRREEEERRQREEMLRQQVGLLVVTKGKRTITNTCRLFAVSDGVFLLRRRSEGSRRSSEGLKRRNVWQRSTQSVSSCSLLTLQLPSSSKWGHQSSSVQPQTQNTLSLAEIQKLEEERERQAREERRQQQELMKALQQQQQQQQQQQAKLSGWGNIAKQPAATKSLLEIQQEEAQQMKQQKQQKKEQQSGGGQQSRTTMGNSVWGCVNNSTPQWISSDVGCSIWGSPDYKSTVGFWDEPVKETVPPSKKNTKNKSNAHVSNSLSGRANKKVEEEEKKLMKLFQGVNNSQDSFTQWCEQTLHTLNTANNLDVPTFASFLKEVDSPYEVHDYIRAYLGDTPEAKDFAKQFLERRAKQKASQQQQLSVQWSVWGVNQTGLQSIFQSNHAGLQQSSFETVQSGKKKKKQKMVRADPSLLGFSVNAASERLNMGEIETVEDF
uniref:GRB10 interacting GYF protein 2 n=1 Tax=Scleropages formosus TaxID=113540 RepID=A0A8C9SS77_SCLFO